ncbi:MAG TPA: ester cyclase [Dehalococcoidia bacterium]
MSAEEKQALVRRFVRHVLNHHRIEPIDRLMAVDFIDHGALPGQAPGRDGFKQRIGLLLASVPDLRLTIENQVVDGDTVISWFTASGTPCGEFSGSTAIGRIGTSRGVTMDRIVNGRFVESWFTLDLLDSPGARHTQAAVLVVDQHRSVAAVAQAVLADSGFIAAWLTPGDHAAVLRTVAATRPAAVLLDSSAGSCFGASWELAQRLHAQDPALPIVLFSTDRRAAVEMERGRSARSRAAGMVAVVRKPFEPEALLATVRRVTAAAPEMCLRR